MARRHERTDGRVVAVCRCGAGHVEPLPTAAELAALYDAAYFEGGAEGIGYRSYLADSTRAAADDASMAAQALRTLERHLPLAGARILEVGAATGALLARLRSAGAEAIGVEPSAAAVEAGRRLFDVDLRVGYLGEVALPPAPFDAVIALEVVEHPVDPGGLVAAMATHLRAGGYLLLTTPNFGMERWYRAGYAGFARSHEHVHYFDARALARLLGRHGFQPVEVQGLGWRWISEGPGESHSRRLVRRILRPLVPRLVPMNLGATTLCCVARRIG